MEPAIGEFLNSPMRQRRQLESTIRAIAAVGPVCASGTTSVTPFGRPPVRLRGNPVHKGRAEPNAPDRPMLDPFASSLEPMAHHSLTFFGSPSVWTAKAIISPMVTARPPLNTFRQSLPPRRQRARCAKERARPLRAAGRDRSAAGRRCRGKASRPCSSKCPSDPWSVRGRQPGR